jgi:hypothetical protein
MRCVSIGLICRRRSHLRRDLRGYEQKRQGTDAQRWSGRIGQASEPIEHRRAALVRSRFQRTAAVNDELSQGQFTLLSGEICMAFRGRFGGAGRCSSGESGMPDSPERNRGSESGRCRSQQTS